MRIHVSDLVVGDRIISDTYNTYGLHILSANTLVSADDISLLFRHNIDYIEIESRGITGITIDNKPGTKTSQMIQPKFDEASQGIKQLFQQVLAEGKIEEHQVKQNFDPLVENFKKETDVVSLLLALNNKDDYTYQHSVQVGMLSYYIAKWMRKNESDALFIGKAGYLHDIGKSKIDEAILQKPGKLTTEEYNEIKKHTVYGYEILNHSLHNTDLSLAALQHHERLNGTGYPSQLLAKKIHPIAKIVAVADVYSAMISSRVYQKKRDLLYVLRELNQISFDELDPFIVQTFIRNMIPNFIGKKVLLKSGEIGEIILTNPSDYFRPLIKANEQFIDLSKERDLDIETIYM